MSIDAMKQALEALEMYLRLDATEEFILFEQITVPEAITALRAAIEQAQEPVAWMYHGIRHDDTPHERPSLIWRPDQMDVMSSEKGAKATPLYTAPSQWQGLTDDEIKAPIQRAMQYFGFDATQYSLGGAATIGFYGLVKEIEAKLKEKNT